MQQLSWRYPSRRQPRPSASTEVEQPPCTSVRDALKSNHFAPRGIDADRWTPFYFSLPAGFYIGGYPCGTERPHQTGDNRLQRAFGCKSGSSLWRERDIITRRGIHPYLLGRKRG